MKILCPAGTGAALKTAVLSGADSVYCGLRDRTNARNFPGLNFSPEELKEGVEFAKKHNVEVLLAINTFPEAGQEHIWHNAVDVAAAADVHAIIVADIGLLDYAKQNHPNLRLHLSVQASASTVEAINFYTESYGVSRVVLPRVISLNKIKEIVENCTAEVEVFVYGGLCVMAEGKCSLSSYTTGLSPNKDGVCSPAHHVTYHETDGKTVSKLNDTVMNVFEEGESPGYPTICKGRFIAEGKSSYLFEEPTSLSIVSMLKELQEIGVAAVKIEGRQRSKAYIKAIVQGFRKALDDIERGVDYDPSELIALSEGTKDTSGAYKKSWL